VTNTIVTMPGMASLRAFAMTAAAASWTDAAPTAVPAAGHTCVLTADYSAIKDAFRGTSAWRPPS
jgi:hypothetical protein